MDYNFLTVRTTNRQPLRTLQAVRNLFLLIGLIYPCVSAGNSLNEICDRQPSSCFTLIDEQQHSLATGSSIWWELEAVRLSSLFKFQKIDELYVALRPWIDNPDVPGEYQPIVAMMYGKWLQVRDRDSEASAILERALNGFRALNQNHESIHLALKILNLLVLLDKLDEAKAYAEKLVDDDYGSPVFYREVFAELAHIAHRTDAHQEHVKYRRESVRWAEQIPDEQQKAIAYNNYGVALRNNGQYKEAQQAFLDGVEFARQANDITQANKLTLRLAEVAFLMRDLNTAQSFLDKVDVSYIPPSQVAKFRKLSNKIIAARYNK